MIFSHATQVQYDLASPGSGGHICVSEVRFASYCRVTQALYGLADLAGVERAELLLLRHWSECVP